MDNFKLDDRVIIIGKSISGKVAFIGETHFSEGEWLGIILDEAKGRNNGSIDGQHYFKCPRNYGLFVRSCQLQKENVQSDLVSSCNAKKIIYPNYLSNSTSRKNKSEMKIRATRELKAKEKTQSFQIYPMTPGIEGFKNSLKCKSQEILSLENQKRESIDQIKDLKIEIQKLHNELKKSAKRENDLKQEMKTTKNDLVKLKRKLFKTETCLRCSEKNRSKLDVTIEGLREITEHAIIEKEIAEEKGEQFEILLKDEADKYKTLEVKLDTMKEEMNLQTTNGVPAVHYVKKIESENEVLKCALLRLRDLYKNLQHEFLNSKREIEKYSGEIGELKNTEKSMEGTISKYREETSELYDIIDSMSNADDIVFEIVEQNLKSEEKIKDLCQALHETENQLELSEEIEETLQEIRIICRDKIECLESKIRHMQTALDHKTILLGEREDIINKYRELMLSLQERNRTLTEDLEAVNKDKKEAILTAESLKLKLQREKRNITKDLIGKETMKYDLESISDELNYWVPFMPDNFFEQYAENAALKVKLIASKMLKKLNLLTRLLQSACCDVNEIDNLQSLALYTEFLTSVYELYGCISLFIKSSDRINLEQFLTLGKYHEILEKGSKEIDSYLTLLGNEDIDRKYCVDNIKNMYCSLSQELNTEYATDDERTMTHLSTYLNIIQIHCKCLLTYYKVWEDNYNNNPEFRSIINLVSEKCTSINMNAKSILNAIQNDENERVNPSSIVEERVKNDWKIIQEITDKAVNKYSQLITKDAINCSRNKECVFLNEIIAKSITVDIDLNELREKLNSGEYLVERIPHSVFSPIFSWAQIKRQKREDVINKMKSEISNCNSEITSLTKKFQRVKKELNKIRNIPKLDASQQTDEQNSCIIDYSTKVSYILMQNDLEETIKYLRQKNSELIFTSFIKQYEMLKPLKVLSKPLYHHETHNIIVLQKKLNKLAVRLRRIILPQVVDITGKTKRSEVIKYKKYLTEKLLIKKEIKDELWKITIIVKKLKTSSRSVWSDRNSFVFQNASLTDM